MTDILNLFNQTKLKLFIF